MLGGMDINQTTVETPLTETKGFRAFRITKISVKSIH